jgi:hypothetical protein
MSSLPTTDITTYHDDIRYPPTLCGNLTIVGMGDADHDEMMIINCAEIYLRRTLYEALARLYRCKILERYDTAT